MNTVRLNVVGALPSGGGGGETQISNGVYIQHIDGKLYTTDKWIAGGYTKDEADGVAVVTDETRFLCHGVGVWTASYKWLDPSITLYGIAMTEDANEAKQDFRGEHNTEIMLAAGSDAAIAVSSYITKSGKKGYLPALGEWSIYQENKAAISEALSLIGGTSVYDSEYSWSSTQKTEATAWAFGFKRGAIEAGAKSVANYRAYPFFPL